ncbi:hypothetical protein HNY73_015947 [Argiope bruennichi]|uniref:DDE-1 domain-containing protein n=1 Tax=Argiope bruennichi TaxID=94029 RepID=A0A8T0EII0_ARGBR|nr:hypothetical protein HNY73_015947 [Argiope bruennichi]
MLNTGVLALRLFNIEKTSACILLAHLFVQPYDYDTPLCGHQSCVVSSGYLFRPVINVDNPASKLLWQCVGGNKNTFREINFFQEEAELSEFVKRESDVYFSLSPKEVRKFAYQFAISLKRKVPDSWEENQQADEDWFSLFLKRNSSLSIRRPEAMSHRRAPSFNKTNVVAFFELSMQCYKYSFGPADIWNMDETEISTVQQPDRLVARWGFKQAGKMTSAERGTLIVDVSAIRNKIPPLFIFPRVHFRDHILNGASTSSTGCCIPSGWMKEENFMPFAEHFVLYTKPTKERRTLLLLGNHDSHLSISTFNYLKANGVVVLNFPPHCSHKLQPLDRDKYLQYNKEKYKYLMPTCPAYGANIPRPRGSLTPMELPHSTRCCSLIF